MMNRPFCQIVFLAALWASGWLAQAQNLDQIGVTLLRAMTTNVDGSGIGAAQPEANTDSNTNDPSAFEVNPAAVNQPSNLFTYASALGTATGFTNAVGNESGHADGVAAIFYGRTGSGVATNVAHVDNFDADYFINYYLVSNLVALADSVVNQSFTFGNVSTNIPTPTNDLAVSDQQAVDLLYDNYAANYGTLFISAVNNGGSVSPPGTAYNSIGVAAFGGSSSVGPTLDNGRCKPDITAPASVTSDSTPQVAGAAALLMQAALRGDGGNDTNAAADIRTVKALLLNGAVKPADWTNTPPSPLDTRYGAGVLNVFNSYEQLAGGRQVYIDHQWIPTGGAHPPAATTNAVAGLSGWDFNALSSLGHPAYDAVNDYDFNATNGDGNANFTLTATLVWNRQQGQTNINNLALFLYNCADSNLVACSTSLVDNIQHIFLPALPQGRYDLQVWKAGANSTVSDSETYALAWEFFSERLTVAGADGNVSLSWPVYPDGFVLQATTNLVPPVTWSTNNPAPIVTNHQNAVRLNAPNAAQFFRLWRP